MPAQNPYNAYQRGGAQQGSYQAAPQAGSPTYTEAWALIEAARRMALAIEKEAADPKEGRAAMREALRLNWRLWTIFQASLLTEESAIPEEIRVNILTLCRFMDQHIPTALTEPTAEKLVTLININRNIASGMLGIDQNAAEQASEPEPRLEEQTAQVSIAETA